MQVHLDSKALSPLLRILLRVVVSAAGWVPRQRRIWMLLSTYHCFKASRSIGARASFLLHKCKSMHGVQASKVLSV